jgi:HEPN domain-containing protein
MINIEMARDYFYRSERCLRETSLEDGDYAGAIRRSQEALEMAVKSLLRVLAIEYPRTPYCMLGWQFSFINRKVY